MELFSNILVPLIILYIVIYGKSKKIDIYDSFVKGAVDGLKSAWSITPYIIGIFLAIGIFKTGGRIEVLEFIFKPIANLMSIPKELIGLIIVKPLSGSGALGIEAVSRGYDHASLVDINHAACSIIKKNVALTKEENRFEIYNMRSSAALKLFAENGQSFDLVFLDPPYAKEKIAKDMRQMNKLGLLNDVAIIVAETDDHTELGSIEGFSLVKEHHLGKTIVRIYRKDK